MKSGRRRNNLGLRELPTLSWPIIGTRTSIVRGLSYDVAPLCGQFGARDSLHAQLQPLRAIQATHSLLVHSPSLATQQHVDPLIPEPRSCMGELPDPQRQGRQVLGLAPAVIARPFDLRQAACACDAHGLNRHQTWTRRNGPVNFRADAPDIRADSVRGPRNTPCPRQRLPPSKGARDANASASV